MGIFTGGWNPFRTPIREAVGGITGSPYLAGKEGWLPDFKLPDPKIKGKPISEVFSAEGYKAGGEWYRKAATSRVEGFATGLFGVGAVEYAKGEEGWLPDWGRPGQFPKVIDPTGKGEGLINITIPEIPKLPEIPKFPEFPDIKIPEFPTFDLAGLGAGVGAGLAGMGLPQMPQMPSFPLTDEEGDIKILTVVALAMAGYGAVYLMTKR